MSRATNTSYIVQTIEEFGFDCCIGGARAVMKKGRAKERIMGFREFGNGTPKPTSNYGICITHVHIR
jgi:hypothetical protein